jgi:hypothetical protein
VAEPNCFVDRSRRNIGGKNSTISVERHPEAKGLMAEKVDQTRRKSSPIESRHGPIAAITAGDGVTMGDPQ